MGSKIEEVEKFLFDAKLLILEITLIVLLFFDCVQFIRQVLVENFNYIYNWVYVLFNYFSIVVNTPFVVIVLFIIILGVILFIMATLNLLIIILFFKFMFFRRSLG